MNARIDEDRAYDDHVQDLLDAKADGYEAGLKGQSVEMNPHTPISPLYTRWLDGWREGLWVLTKQRAA